MVEHRRTRKERKHVHHPQTPARQRRCRKAVIDLIAVWRAEHADYAQLLDQLDRQLADLAAGRSADHGRMRDIVSVLRHAPDRIHHPREDAALACLVKRDPSLLLPVNRLRQEHRVVAAAGEELLLRLNQALAGPPADADNDAIEAAAAVYLLYYRHHLAVEERDILPRAAGLLSPDDWRSVADAVAAAAAAEDDDPRA